jgi:hypothetical protein
VWPCRRRTNRRRNSHSFVCHLPTLRSRARCRAPASPSATPTTATRPWSSACFHFARPKIEVGILTGQGAEDAAQGSEDVTTLLEVAIYNEFGTTNEDVSVHTPAGAKRSSPRGSTNASRRYAPIRSLMQSVLRGERRKDRFCRFWPCGEWARSRPAWRPRACRRRMPATEKGGHSIAGVPARFGDRVDGWPLSGEPATAAWGGARTARDSIPSVVRTIDVGEFGPVCPQVDPGARR